MHVRRRDPISHLASGIPPPLHLLPAERAMAKARSSAKQSRAQAQAQQQNGGHALSSKLARYLDPEASWDKVRPAALAPDLGSCVAAR